MSIKKKPYRKCKDKTEKPTGSLEDNFFEHLDYFLPNIWSKFCDYARDKHKLGFGKRDFMSSGMTCSQSVMNVQFTFDSVMYLGIFLEFLDSKDVLLNTVFLPLVEGEAGWGCEILDDDKPPIGGFTSREQALKQGIFFAFQKLEDGLDKTVTDESTEQLEQV